MRGSRRRASASIENPNVCRAAADQAERHAPRAKRNRGGDAVGAVPMARAGRPAAIASTTPFSVATSGVIVSSRAKNAGDSAFTSTWAGSASVSHISARGRRRGVISGEGAVLEQQPHDRLAEHDQPERCRQRQANREFEAARFRMRNGGAIRTPAPRASIPGSAPVPMATPTMPSGSSTSRLAK